MTVDYIIIGQGICGTMLSWFLHKEGKSFVVIDDEKSYSASRIAAGIINPVTGRRYVTTWMIEDVMPFAIGAFTEMELAFGDEFVFRKNIIDFFPSVQMREAFIKRINEDDTYVKAFPDQNLFNSIINYDFGCGEITPAYTVNLQSILQHWKKKLQQAGSYICRTIESADINLTDDGVSLGDISAQKIIFCNGIDSMNEEWFRLLPFAPNKGEALLIECKDMNSQYIFKRSMMLAPMVEKDCFWVGSNYLWEYDNAQPSENFMAQTTTLLNKWLKLPYKIIDHRSSIRPATLERRPFVGFHPQHPALGIFNGMGSKGTSLAPYFANQMVQHLLHGFPIAEEASLNRFARILSK